MQIWTLLIVWIGQSLFCGLIFLKNKAPDNYFSVICFVREPTLTKIQQLVLWPRASR